MQPAPRLRKPRLRATGRGDGRTLDPLRPLVIRIPLTPVGDSPEAAETALQPCPRCGSKGFNVHQRTWKAVKDPQVRRVQVVRYLCKRCGYVRRVYPTGIGPGRQTNPLKQLTVLLWCAGLSLETIRVVLAGLGGFLSASAIHSNVVAFQRAIPAEPQPDAHRRYLRLKPDGDGRLSGPDGQIALRLASATPLRRWLEVEIAPGPNAAYLQWRWEAGARWVTAALRRLGWPLGFPPGSA